jgi:hypothetical protein
VVETEAKKLNIATQVIPKSSVATMVETHIEIDTTIIEVDNQMVVIQVQVGKTIVEDVMIDGRASVNIIKNQNKFKLIQTKTGSISPQNGISKYD